MKQLDDTIKKSKLKKREPDTRWTPMVEHKNLNFFVSRHQSTDDKLQLNKETKTPPQYMYVLNHSLHLARSHHTLEDAKALDLDPRILSISVNQLPQYVSQ